LLSVWGAGGGGKVIKERKESRENIREWENEGNKRQRRITQQKRREK